MPEITGDDQPSPGIVVFHLTFVSSLHSSGTDTGAFGDSTASVTMQVRLDGSDDSIEYHYDEITSAPLFDASGDQAAIGTEGNGGTFALEIACQTSGVVSSGGPGFRIESGPQPPPPPP